MTDIVYLSKLIPLNHKKNEVELQGPEVLFTRWINYLPFFKSKII